HRPPKQTHLPQPRPEALAATAACTQSARGADIGGGQMRSGRLCVHGDPRPRRKRAPPRQKNDTHRRIVLRPIQRKAQLIVEFLCDSVEPLRTVKSYFGDTTVYVIDN